jgi:poly(hydroxyalkanoate) depolymerase family esterase
MNDRAYHDVLEATRLTRAGRLTEATALLQRMLRSGIASAAAPGSTSDAADAPPGGLLRIMEGAPEKIEETDPQPSPRTGQSLWTGISGEPAGTARLRTPEALQGFLERISRTGFEPGPGGLARPSPPPVPDGGQFLARSYSNEAGSRTYKLYVPSGYRGQEVPLIVMLHGCTQSPDDFAAGTRMNALAEEHTCLVAYPAQSASANPSRCWNWYSAGDQQRGQGEPSLIAGITRQVMRDYSVDPQRVYVAGLSAGASAAAIMGMTYPDLYAAIGVHSGLACGAASDLPSAFAAMRQGEAATGRRSRGAAGAPENRWIVPTIVFHGDQDTTVHPRNGDQVLAQSRPDPTTGLRASVQHGQVPDGHAYTRTLHTDASGKGILEHWIIHGAGHAWSGGSPAGSYTDPQGPEAAREMVRFFLEHPHPKSMGQA